MSLFEYEVGVRVRDRRHEDRKGKVVEVEDYSEVYVLWDGTSEAHWCETRDLMPDDPEAINKIADFNRKIQANIDEATTLLEQAFKKWRLANAMEMEGTETPGDDRNYFEGAYALRGNPDLDLSKFEGVVENNGWSTSALYC